MNPHQLLVHPEVARSTCAALMAKGIRKQDVQDALQEVYMRALRFFRVKPDAAPTELGNMQAFCARVARNHAVDQYRKAKTRKTDLEAHCDREEFGMVERQSVPRRDPIDAQRQLEVLADLFREGRMPEGGIEILERIASKCTLDEIGQDLGITLWAVRGRVDTMRKTFRQRMAKLGLLPSMQSLTLVVSSPTAIETLRRAA
jgi:RNA polymerase sigma factor (sigma-70 family)